MRSLYESILKSVNAGKNTRLTVEYALAHGCTAEPKLDGVVWLYYKDTRMCFGSTKLGDITYSLYYDHQPYTVVKVVKTISDFDLCCQYMEKLASKDNKKDIDVIKHKIEKQLEPLKK